MLQLGSLPSERDCLHRVARTLTHSMSREGMECGLRFRVLELVAGIYRLQAGIYRLHHQCGKVVTMAVGFSPAMGC